MLVDRMWLRQHVFHSATPQPEAHQLTTEEGSGPTSVTLKNTTNVGKSILRNVLSFKIKNPGAAGNLPEEIKNTQLIDYERGGAGGIRTLDTVLRPYNGLANHRLQPLGHSS